jgi:hypothetical protein
MARTIWLEAPNIEKPCRPILNKSNIKEWNKKINNIKESQRKKKEKERCELSWVNLLNPQAKLWDQDNPIKRKIKKKNNEAYFF